jgi:putative ABC transport system permease protein
METLLQDLRYGVRVLLKSPGFTAVAVIALALGIGANTAIFSVVNSVMLRPLPYENPDRLVMVWEYNRPRGRDRNVISPANFIDWREQNTVFEQMAAFVDFRTNLTGVEDPEELPVQAVTVNTFSMLGASPHLGRTFLPEDEKADGERTIILSQGLWRRRFGADPNIVGNQIALDGQSYTVIGVMPTGFQLFIQQDSFSGKQAEVWMPIRFTPNHRVRRGRSWRAIAQLKPGVTVAQAQEEMSAIAGRLEQQYSDFNSGWDVNIVPLREQIVGGIRQALLVLLGAVGFVLLIACGNVANLLLARAATRQKEMAIRAALGASRLRVVRQLLTESVLLSVLGGGLGLLLALWGVDALLALSPKNLLVVQSVSLDTSVLGFALGVSVLTGVIFGVVPAFIASRSDLNESLKEGGKSAASGERGHRVRSMFVVAEVALALVLLIGSGLMIKSFLRLQAVDAGFRPENLLTARVLLPGSKYGQDPQVIGFFRQAVERLRSSPGVRSASAIAFLPFAGPGAGTSFAIVGRPDPPPSERPVTDVRVIEPDYFSTMGIPMLSGRTFNEGEATEARHVVVINEYMASRYFPGEDPIGKQVTINMKATNIPSEIIGVVGNVKHAGLDVETRSMAYWPHPELAYPFMTLVVRTEADPLLFAGSLQREIRAIDQDQPVADVRTMDAWIADSVSRARFSTLLLGIFAGLALILAAVGIYGVMSYSVTERTHEIGVRMALGARPGDVLRLVVRQGMTLAVLGVGIGLGAAAALTRVMSSLLFGVSVTDPVTFVAIPIVLVGVALAAAAVPARRASRVDPMVALRYE